MILRHPVRLFAALLLLVGMGLAIFGVVRSADGWNWSDESAVPVDGETHEVETINRTVWLWVREDASYDGSACTATDAWGDALDKSELPEGVTRPGGDGGDHVALWEFHTYGPTAHITCEPTGAEAGTVLHAEASPKVVAVAANDPWVVRGVLVGFAAVIIFLVALLVDRAHRRAVTTVDPGEAGAPSDSDQA